MTTRRFLRTCRLRSVARGAIALLGLTLIACAGSTPGGTSGSSGTASAGAPAPASTVAVGTAAATTPAGDTGAAGGPIDACALLTQAEVEREAGGPVTMTTPVVGEPNPRKETQCSYKAANVVLDVRTSIGRRDYDLEHAAAVAQGRKVADLPGLGDAAFSDRGQLVTSVDVLARGRWLRVSGSFDRNRDLESMTTLATAAVARLP
jgi:hypothetical protein